jgi:hypothetical protein
MATTYKADNYSDPMPSLPDPLAHKRVFKFTLGAAFVIEDIVSLCPLQALSGLVLLDYYIDVPDLDTGATPTITLDLGFDGTNEEDDLVDGSTVGQAAGKISMDGDGVAGAMPKTLTTDKVLQLHVDAAPQTGATTGTIKGWLEYLFYSRAITL